MTLKFSRLPDAQVAEAFDVLKQVGQWIDSQGLRQRISKTPFESYSRWQSEQANYIVTSASEIVGLVTLRNELLDDWPEFLDLGPVLMLRALATHPDHLGTGVGAFAIRESILIAEPDQPIFLDCVSDSLPRYYARFGFRQLARRTKTYPDGETYDITLMQLQCRSLGLSQDIAADQTDST